MNDEGVTAVLGIVLVHLGGEVRIPHETLQNGLPANSGVQVYSDPITEELVVKIETQEVDEEVEE